MLADDGAGGGFRRWEVLVMTRVVQPSPVFSKALFGNSYMFAVMTYIAGLEEETFSPKQVADATGLLGSVVHPLVHRLRDAEMIEYVGRAADGRTTLYRTVPRHWWIAAKLYAAGEPDAFELQGKAAS